MPIEVAVGVFLIGSPLGSFCLRKMMKNRLASKEQQIFEPRLGDDDGTGLALEDNPGSPSGSPLAKALPEDEALGEDTEFELWVETDLSASWCLETPLQEAADATKQWQKKCSTAKLRRCWEDFAALGNTFDAGVSGGQMSFQDALQILGLGGDGKMQPTLCEVSSAFRRKAREQHPDKVGAGVDFHRLQTALQVVRASPEMK